jgi:hypothetical protein
MTISVLLTTDVHDAIMLERQSFEDVDQIENTLGFAKRSRVFGDEYAATQAF